MSTSEASRTTHRDVLHAIGAARGAPVTANGSNEVVAMALSPRDPAGDPGTEWMLLDRAVHAMEARDWPSVIVPISRASLTAPSFTYRLRDLAEQHDMPTDRIWLEVDSSKAALELAGVVSALAQRHPVGCRMPIDRALEERALLPDLVTAGVSFAWLQPGDARSIADDLSSLIGGRSLIRRARLHGVVTIGPADVCPDMVPPLAP